MTPSKAAIEAAEQKRIESGFALYRVQTESMLQAAYAIDFAVLQQENERNRTLLRELAEALKEQIPSYNNPVDQCWCPNHLALKDGEHSPKCVKARAALARAEEVLNHATR